MITTATRRKAVGIAAALAALVVVLPALRDREDQSTARFLETHPAYAKAILDGPLGAVHHEHGAGQGPIVVLVHGVSGPMSVWDATCATLRDAGRAYLRLDLYGRGGSARLAPAAYTLDAYADEVVAAVDRVAPGAALHLVGSSMGALVVSEVAKRRPRAVRSVTFVGPAGFPLEATPVARLMRVPVVGDWAMRTFGDAQLAAHQRRYFVHPERFDAQHALFEDQLRVRGSKAAILATTRGVPLQNYEAGFAALAAEGHPVTVFWGTEDRTFPIAHAAALLRAVPHAKLVRVEGAAHLPQLERADVVGAGLLRALEDAERAATDAGQAKPE